MHRVAVRRRTGLEDSQQRTIVVAGQRLHLHPDIVIPDQVQHFLQQGERFAIADPDLPGLGRAQLRDRAHPREIGVVVHDDGPVAGRMHVELDAVGIQHDGAAERGPRVFVFVPRGAAVGDDVRASHGPKGSPA